VTKFRSGQIGEKTRTKTDLKSQIGKEQRPRWGWRRWCGDLVSSHHHLLRSTS